MTRKRAQEDVKLLANRIQLLKAEEEKVSGLSSASLLLIRRTGLEEDRGHEEEGQRDPERASAQHGKPPAQGRGGNEALGRRKCVDAEEHVDVLVAAQRYIGAAAATNAVTRPGSCAAQAGARAA